LQNSRSHNFARDYEKQIDEQNRRQRFIYRCLEAQPRYREVIEDSSKGLDDFIGEGR